jgi:hypothetical protein
VTVLRVVYTSGSSRSKRHVGASVGAQHSVDDVDHAPVLEDAAVAAVPQERGPRFQCELVTRKAAIRARQLDCRHMSMKWPQLVTAVGGQELEQHRLADQRFEGDRRVERQGSNLEAEQFAQAFFAPDTFGEQDIRAEWRRQPQKAGVLCKARERQFREGHGTWRRS